MLSTEPRVPLPLTCSMTTGQSLLLGPCFLICREGNSQNVLTEEKAGVGYVFSISTCLMGMIPSQAWRYGVTPAAKGT